MRISMQCGRSGSARHNDRSFDVEKATHIDKEKMKDSVMRSWLNDKSVSFVDDEMAYYEKKFSKALERTNQKYIESRHKEKCTTIEKWYKGKKTCPEETIWQVGDMHEHTDSRKLLECYIQLSKERNAWSMEHGQPFKVLDFALHDDEATPHIHERKVWQYRDTEGLWRIGQEEALKQAGIELPNPSEPIGRTNNRKMSFDAIWRARFQEICQEKGLDIEMQPRKERRKHKQKEDFIYDEVQRLKEEREKVADEVQDLKREHDIIIDEIEELHDESLDLAYEIIEAFEERAREKIR